MDPSFSLVGRDKELEFLMDQMAISMAGQGRLVMVSGEAGSGKTALCTAFTRLAAKSDGLVLTGRCVPGSPSPYLPFVEAFTHLSRNPLVLRGDPSAINASRLMFSVLESMEDLSKTRTLILFLEDLHWADSASILLLHFLARNIRARKIMILGTYRPEDIHTDPSGEPHPLKESLRMMRREGVCCDLELQLLSPSETRELVPMRLGGKVEEPLLDLVVEDSKGNPLFAVEMINYLAASKQIVSVDGIWRLHLMRLQTPSTIKEVVLARTESIPRPIKRVLELASVIGPWFEPQTIEEILGLPRDRVLGSLQELDREYFLVSEADGWYQFSHEKVRQVVYDEISPLWRQELHRCIALSLEKRLPNDELLGQLSWHFERANDRERCLRHSLSAGRYCHHRKAVREAKSYFLKVLARTEGDERFVQERLQALESLGDLRSHVSSLTEWYSYYEKFLALNQDRKARARVLTKASECLDQTALVDKERATAFLDEAEAISDGDPEIMANVEFQRSDLYSTDCLVDEALDHIAKAVRYFEQINDTLGVLRCGEEEVIVLRQANRLREAKMLSEKLLRAAKDTGDPEREVMTSLLMGFCSVMIGETQPAKEHLTTMIELAGKLGMMWYWRLGLQIRGWVFELEGDPETAKRDVTLALENAIELDSPMYAALFESDLGLYEMEMGNLGKAELHYEAALQRLSGYGSFPRVLIETDLAILHADLLAQRGDFRESNEAYERAIEFNQERAHTYEVMNCQSRYGVALARRGRRPEAERQFKEAMELAKEMGCEKRVQIFAKRAGVAL